MTDGFSSRAFDDDGAGGVALAERALIAEKGVASLGSEYPAIARAYREFDQVLRSMPTTEREALAQQGQERWSGTMLAARQRHELVSWLNSIGSAKLDKIDTIIDLGAGDGRVVEAVWAETGLGRQLKNVILVDRNAAGLDEATRRLRRCHEAGISVQTRCLDLRAPAVWTGVEPRSTLVLASAALHELDREDKGSVLSLAARNASWLILVELAADHDAPSTQNAEFRHRAAGFYDALVADAFSSLPADDHRSVVGAFLLGELEVMLTVPYAARQNYHLTAEKWRSQVIAGGFEPAHEHLADLLPGGPPTYFLLAAGQIRASRRLSSHQVL